jgi:hypothetical protein
MKRLTFQILALLSLFVITSCAALGSAKPDAGTLAAKVHPLTIQACAACEEAKALGFPLRPEGAAACEQACKVAKGLCSE